MRRGMRVGPARRGARLERVILRAYRKRGRAGGPDASLIQTEICGHCVSAREGQAMRQETKGSTRSNALWGRRGESRKRTLRTSLIVVVMLVVATPVVAAAQGPSRAAAPSAFISPGLTRAARDNPGAMVSVIV